MFSFGIARIASRGFSNSSVSCLKLLCSSSIGTSRSSTMKTWTRCQGIVVWVSCLSVPTMLRPPGNASTTVGWLSSNVVTALVMICTAGWLTSLVWISSAIVKILQADPKDLGQLWLVKAQHHFFLIVFGDNGNRHAELAGFLDNHLGGLTVGRGVNFLKAHVMLFEKFFGRPAVGAGGSGVDGNGGHGVLVTIHVLVVYPFFIFV